MNIGSDNVLVGIGICISFFAFLLPSHHRMINIAIEYLDFCVFCSGQIIKVL